MRAHKFWKYKREIPPKASRDLNYDSFKIIILPFAHQEFLRLVKNTVHENEKNDDLRPKVLICWQFLAIIANTTITWSAFVVNSSQHEANMKCT